jgi:hypothetical protein
MGLIFAESKGSRHEDCGRKKKKQLLTLMHANERQ